VTSAHVRVPAGPVPEQGTGPSSSPGFLQRADPSAPTPPAWRRSRGRDHGSVRWRR